MPYIEKRNRELIGNNIREPMTAGELNYKITTMCVDYLNQQKLSYVTINEIIGVLECAKQEFYRRVAIPYEDHKIKENGDVY